MIDPILAALSRLSAAEEFLDFLEVPYDPQIVHVNRLHILKRFQKYLFSARAPAERTERELRLFYQGLLEQAYQDFATSTPLQEREFAVFQRPVSGKPAAATIAIEDLRSSLRGRPASGNAHAGEGGDLRSGGEVG
ncbi:MAG: nitrogenase-stabilizing/protective protein NifW [Candidatus Methylacidiphilaceae bacterium]